MTDISSDITIGFVPLLDSAVLVSAREKGFFAAEGLRVKLVREAAWAAIRDHLAVGHFQAAHVLGPMPIATNLGLFPLSPALVAPIALGLGGNAITVSEALGQAMAAAGDALDLDPTTSGAALKRVVAARQAEGLPALKFGVVYAFSGHNFELRYWLKVVGIDPDRDIETVILPPPFMADALAKGRIDGYCVGEPWNTVAVHRDLGRMATVKARLWRSSPEKVLGVAREFAEAEPEVLDAIVRAIYRAADWCGQPENHGELAALLGAPAYLDLPAELLAPALSGRIRSRPGHVALEPDFFTTSAGAATFPWQSHALWFYSQMVRWGYCAHSPRNAEIARTTYRPDLFRRALATAGVALPEADSKVEGALSAPTPIPARHGDLTLPPDGFFDGRTFDPNRLDAYLADLGAQ